MGRKTDKPVVVDDQARIVGAGKRAQLAEQRGIGAGRALVAVLQPAGATGEYRRHGFQRVVGQCGAVIDGIKPAHAHGVSVAMRAGIR